MWKKPRIFLWMLRYVISGYLFFICLTKLFRKRKVQRQSILLVRRDRIVSRQRKKYYYKSPTMYLSCAMKFFSLLGCVNGTSWICTFFLVCCFSSVLWYYHLKSFCQYCVVLFLGGGFVNVNDWLWIATNSYCLFSFTDEFIQDRVTGGNELARKIFFAGHSFVVEN